jgi:heme/copper-type cytochrome/quinol oxidase subunit 1
MTALRGYLLAAIGAVLLVIGIVIVTTQPVGFGWTAYAPLTDVTFTPPFPTPAMWIGGALAAVGLALLAGWVGFRLGRRARRSADS